MQYLLLAPGHIAYSSATSDPASKWPARGSGNRLHPECMPQVRPGFHLEPGEAVFTIGSCFARNIEIALHERGFHVPCMDFKLPESEFWPNRHTSGALNKYSPFSMLNEINFALDTPKALEPEQYLLEGAKDQFSDYQMHVRGAVSGERAIQRRLEVRELYRSGLAQSRVVVITLGMAEAWFDRETGIYLNDAPSPKMTKLYAERFEFRVVGYNDLFECVRDTIALLRSARGSDLRVVLTVSPVPLQRTFSGSDVITANTYSKSVLRAVAGAITAMHDFVDYFPSFEAVIFSEFKSTWKDDQVHVTLPTVRRVVSNMIEAYAAPSPEKNR